MKRTGIGIFLLLIVTAGFAVAQQNTLRDARVGEFAIYSTSNGAMQERHTVISRRQNVVVVKVESIINGRTISHKVENYNVANPPFLRGASGQQRINAAGKSYTCSSVTRGRRTLYYSNQVPVTGLVAVHVDGRPVKEIVNFGN